MAYTIVYNSNGGDDTFRTTVSYTAENGTPFNLMKRPGFIYRQGYTFIGWGTSTFDVAASYQDQEYIDTDLAPSGGIRTLYAVWRKNDQVDLLRGISLAIAGRKPLANQGAVPSQTLVECLTTMGWVVDDASIVYDANTYLGKNNSVPFYKYRDGFAICVYSHQDTFRGACLISTDRSYAAYKTSLTGGEILPHGSASFSYDGATWYFNTQSYNTGEPSDSTTFAEFNMGNGTASTISALIPSTIFPALGYRKTTFFDTKNITKGFEVGNALCKMI